MALGQRKHDDPCCAMTAGAGSIDQAKASHPEHVLAFSDQSVLYVVVPWMLVDCTCFVYLPLHVRMSFVCNCIVRTYWPQGAATCQASRLSDEKYGAVQVEELITGFGPEVNATSRGASSDTCPAGSSTRAGHACQ